MSKPIEPAEGYARTFHYKQDGGRNGGGHLLDGVAYRDRPRVPAL